MVTLADSLRFATTFVVLSSVGSAASAEVAADDTPIMTMSAPIKASLFSIFLVFIILSLSEVGQRLLPR
jgi:hypothetical protein